MTSLLWPLFYISRLCICTILYSRNTICIPLLKFCSLFCNASKRCLTNVISVGRGRPKNMHEAIPQWDVQFWQRPLQPMATLQWVLSKLYISTPFIYCHWSLMELLMCCVPWTTKLAYNTLYTSCNASATSMTHFGMQIYNHGECLSAYNCPLVLLWLYNSPTGNYLSVGCTILRPPLWRAAAKRSGVIPSLTHYSTLNLWYYVYSPWLTSLYQFIPDWKWWQKQPITHLSQSIRIN